MKLPWVAEIRQWWRWGGRKPVADATADGEAAAICRLQTELTWYHESALRKKRSYRGLKFVEVTVAAAVPVGASLGWSVVTVGILGGAIVACQATQQLFQLHAQWLSHRSTYELLKREESLYWAKAGPYRDDEARGALLAERVEAVRALETSQWVEAELAAVKSKGQKPDGPG